MKATKLVLLMFVVALSAHAEGWMTTLSYNVAIPGQQMKPFISNPSLLGFALDARRIVSPHVSVGASLGHQVFYWKTGQAVSLENGFFGGTQYRFLNTLPFMLNSHYYFHLKNELRPYLGINLGGYYAWQRSEIGIVVMEGRQWNWGLAPEVGMLIPVGASNLNVGTKLSYLGLPGETTLGDPRQQLFASIYLGLSFYHR